MAMPGNSHPPIVVNKIDHLLTMRFDQSGNTRPFRGLEQPVAQRQRLGAAPIRKHRHIPDHADRRGVVMHRIGGGDGCDLRRVEYGMNMRC